MFGKKGTLGFWLTDAMLDAALVQRGRKTHKTLASAGFANDGLLSEDGRAQKLSKAFRSCLKKLPGTVRRADTPAVLALPDHFIEEDVFSFAEFPKSKTEARALVAHRLSREMNLPADELDVAWDQVASQDDATVIRVRAINRAMRRDIEVAAATAGLRLIRIDGWVGYAQLDRQIAQIKSGSAVWCDGSGWSLLCWGGADAAGFHQTGRLEGAGDMAADILRVSLSYARRNGIEPGPISTDVPETLATSLSAAAKAAGVAVSKLPAISRAERVASWG